MARYGSNLMTPDQAYIQAHCGNVSTVYSIHLRYGSWIDWDEFHDVYMYTLVTKI